MAGESPRLGCPCLLCSLCLFVCGSVVGWDVLCLIVRGCIAHDLDVVAVVVAAVVAFVVVAVAAAVFARPSIGSGLASFAFWLSLCAFVLCLICVRVLPCR